MVLAVLAFFLGTGCVARPEPVALDLTGAAACASVSDLAAVLSAAVTEDGRIEPSGLKPVTDCLERQLQTMAISGPSATPNLFPTDQARWSYWLNARTAWALKLAAVLGFPAQADPRAMRTRTFPLDGREMSLDAIDEILLRQARRTGDFRLAACAPGVLVDYAPVPTRPFVPENLSSQLQEMLNLLVLDGRRFDVDVDGMEVRIPPLLWACRDMIIAQYQQRYGARDANLLTALGPHLNARAFRRLQDALGYKTVPQQARWDLAVPKQKIFYPGKIGRIEP